MKDWTPQGWAAFILACTVPFFLVLWLLNTLLGESKIQDEEMYMKNTQIWIGLIASIVSGLLVWIANNNNKEDNNKL